MSEKTGCFGGLITIGLAALPLCGKFLDDGVRATRHVAPEVVSYADDAARAARRTGGGYSGDATRFAGQAVDDLGRSGRKVLGAADGEPPHRLTTYVTDPFSAPGQSPGRVVEHGANGLIDSQGGPDERHLREAFGEILSAIGGDDADDVLDDQLTFELLLDDPSAFVERLQTRPKTFSPYQYRQLMSIRALDVSRRARKAIPKILSDKGIATDFSALRTVIDGVGLVQDVQLYLSNDGERLIVRLRIGEDVYTGAFDTDDVLVATAGGVVLSFEDEPSPVEEQVNGLCPESRPIVIDTGTTKLICHPAAGG